ncbi:uncharacterized protein [Rutidosis leptorrhynchoides]|uniref:uncharacterized protein n=1 Tax=Rutidosis leptorrhynchoides TaxID=125765 RepID=UPI003A99A228
MVYDSIANASIPTPASNSKDIAKKKRVNRTAKLKQSKLDVRREQWLSQVKNKGLGLKEGTNVTKMAVLDTHAAVKERDRDMVKLEISVGGGVENEGLMNQYSDSESNSPTSHTSSVSGSITSGTNFTVSSGMSSYGSSSSSGSGGCGSGNMTDEDDGHINDDDEDDDCLDDWEAMADALEADEIKKDDDGDANLESRVHETARESEPVLTTKAGREINQARASVLAWRPDDVMRPLCLPNLLKQHSFPMKSGMRHCAGFVPSSCPICCEDLDMTDSSFLPCPCGYRLCLFCHKRILEDNGRCPGCRKPYEQPDQSAPLKVARCYSMNQMR